MILRFAGPEGAKNLAGKMVGREFPLRHPDAPEHLDPSDPPVFIGHAEGEVVPVGQSRRFAAALQTAGIPVELAIVPGTEHSIGILDEALRGRVAAFLHAHIG